MKNQGINFPISLPLFIQIIDFLFQIRSINYKYYSTELNSWQD